MDLAFGGSFNKPLEGNLASSDGPPDFSSRKGKGEVYEFESTGDVPILVTNFLGGNFRNVISAEYTQRGVHVEMTGDHHDGMGFSVGADPIAEMFSGDLVLNVEVKAVKWVSASATSQERTNGTDPSALRVKRALRALRYATCSLPVRKTLKSERVISTESRLSGNLGHLPIVRKDDLLRGMDETWLGVGRRVEDFARILV